MSRCFNFFKDCNSDYLESDVLGRIKQITQWKKDAANKVRVHIVNLMEEHLEDNNKKISLQMKYFREDNLITDALKEQFFFTNTIHNCDTYEEIDIVLSLTYQYTDLERAIFTENIQHYINIMGKITVWSVGQTIDLDLWYIKRQLKVRVPTPEGGFTTYIYDCCRILPPSILYGDHSNPEYSINDNDTNLDSNEKHKLTEKTKNKLSSRKCTGSSSRHKSINSNRSDKKQSTKVQTSNKLDAEDKKKSNE